jgi:hypothetical protein
MARSSRNFCARNAEFAFGNLKRVFCLLLILSAAPGCSSYFRTGEMSAEELKQRQQERLQEQQRFVDPKSPFFDD